MQRTPNAQGNSPDHSWINRLVSRDQGRSLPEYVMMLGIVALIVCAVGIQLWLFRATGAAARTNLSLLMVTGWLLSLLLLAWQWYGGKGQDAPNLLEGQSDRREPLPPALQERIFAKRQLIYKILASDKRILLESRMEVRHIMTDDLSVVSPATTVAEMIVQMTQKTIRHLLVCEAGRLVGVVSDRDLRNRKGNTASEIMTPRPVTVSPTTPVDWTVTMLIRHGFSCLPVVDGDRLCGMLTSTDLMMTLQCSLKLLEQVIQQVRPSPESAQDPCDHSATGSQNDVPQPIEEEHITCGQLCADAVGATCHTEHAEPLN